MLRQILDISSKPYPTHHPISNHTQQINRTHIFNPSNQHQRRSLSQRKNKIALTSSEDDQSKKIQNMRMDIFLKALNNSMTMRISGSYQQLQITDLIFQYALQLQSPSQKKIPYEKTEWFIVEVDESKLLKSDKLFYKRLCGSESEQSSQRPQYLTLYQIIFPMDGRQMRLTSLQDPKKFYNINLDLIETCLIIPQQTSLDNHDKLTLMIHELFQLDIYFGSATLPFSLKKIENFSKIQTINKNRFQAYLTNKLQNSRGVQFNLFSQIFQKDSNFIHKSYATEQQFAKFCQTGDILLFKDNHTMAKVQRFITNSDYDHVGIVYKSEKYGICLFQSGSGSGVAMTLWNQLIRHKWYQNIERVTWRKLQTKRGEEFQQKVGEFIKANLHKQFGISIPKLLKFKSLTVQNFSDKNQTYFCSQLVATLYKYLGLLESTKSATQYWPKDFSQKGNINMLSGSLSRERQIVFQEKILKENYKYLK